jgi:hypothetical protein
MGSRCLSGLLAVRAERWGCRLQAGGICTPQT